MHTAEVAKNKVLPVVVKKPDLKSNLDSNHTVNLNCNPNVTLMISPANAAAARTRSHFTQTDAA